MIFGFFVNLKLRVKLLLAFGSLLILTLVLVLIFFQILRKVDSYWLASDEIDGVNIHLMEMDASISNFIHEGFKNDDFQKEGTSKFLDSYSSHQLQLNEGLSSLEKMAIFKSSTDSISVMLDNLSPKVDNLILQLGKRGFKDFGLEGELREAIHRVEKSPYSYSKVDMLTLRRHEKDFFLRKDLKYREEFNKKVNEFIQFISNESNPNADAERISILENLNLYKKKFNQAVASDSTIGLKENEGVKGSIYSDLDNLKNTIKNLRSAIKITTTEYKESSSNTLLIVFFAELLLCVVLAILYSDLITTAIKQILRVMSVLSEGNFPAKLIVKSGEEIGKTKMAFNQLLDRIQAAVEFSKSLGEGNLKTVYDDRFKGDIFAKSLVKMQEQLLLAHESQSKASWKNYGAAQMNDILKNENEDLNILGDKILKLLVTYLGANQGALYVFIKNESEQFLERLSTYAYDKKRFVSNRVEIGSGQVGQCFLENNPVILNDIPSDYIKITSGMGEATPRSLVIIPITINGNATGVIELASFEIFQDYKIKFLKDIGESIASILHNKNVNANTVKLLGEAREREQQLREQEEELRQNAEEVLAVQEQMMRQKNELEKEVKLLKLIIIEQGLEARLN